MRKENVLRKCMIGLVGLQACLTLFAAVKATGQESKSVLDQKETQAVAAESKQSANGKVSAKSKQKQMAKAETATDNKDTVPTPDTTALPATQAGKMTKKTNYKKYSNTSIGWGVSMHADHTTPGGNVPKGVSLKKYQAYYVGNTKEKVMYLTFDCGYEGGYTRKILKTLKKENLKAIFFVTKPFIEENPKLVKKMKKEGHLVGNHTCTHPQLSKCNVAKIRKEINDCAKTMKKLTGYNMDAFIRPPEGVYSLRALKVIKDMGYKTILWSIAYYDYDPQNQPSVDYVVNKFKTYYHKGAIPLMHIVSKADCEALPKIIRLMHSKKYHFKTLDELD